MEKNKQKTSVQTQARDVNSKEIFKNPTLCAQFLQDNVDISQLKQVQPEDFHKFRSLPPEKRTCIGMQKDNAVRYFRL